MSRLLYPHTKSSQSVQDSLSTDELRYWLALLYAPGVGPVLFQCILSVKYNQNSYLIILRVT